MGYARAVGLLVAAVAAAMSLYHMWTTAFGPPEAVFFRGTHLIFAFVLVFLTHPLRRRPTPGIEDWALLALSVGSVAHLFLTYDHLVNRIIYIDDPTRADTLWGWTCVALVMEAARRVIGWALPVTAVAFLLLGATILEQPLPVLLDQLYLTTEGIFGSTLGVSAGFVVVFVLFGAFMERSGVGRLFMEFALALTGRAAGGPGKVAVISSSLFGSVSGSAVANVMVTGQVTIPLMKRTGFRPPFAAAVEAVASTGGQIMPPIMGAAAFVMAEFLQVQYLQVIGWAILPSLLFYVAAFGAVHFEAKRSGLEGLSGEEVPRLANVLGASGHLFVPIAVVLGGLFLGYSAPLSALAGTLACFPVAALRAGTRGAVTPANLGRALVEGATGTLAIAMACACAGIVIGVITLSGLGIIFTQYVLAAAQNSLVLALILTMVAGIILGMGMPTTPAYIVMVSLLVPALIRLGVAAPAAHMFAFYFAILSAITPPVALAVFAAAGLARSDQWSTGLAAVKMGAAGFIVPFMFVYSPALLMIGTWMEVAHAVLTASLGCLLLAAGLHGYLLARAGPLERALMVAAALTLIKPGWATDAVGLGLSAAALALQVAARRRAAPAG
ncbi:MAG: TRAP transporter fused permease subunit [Acetobacteraceae bacterium]